MINKIIENPMFFVVSLLLIIVLFIIAFKLSKMAVSEKSDKRLILAYLIMLFGIGLFSYLTKGDILPGDAHSHIGRTWLFYDSFLHDGEIPIWDNHWYCGYPIGLYYGFLYYTLSGALSLLNDDVIVTTKLLLWILHIISGIIFFYLVRFLNKSYAPAIYASIFYVFSFQHLGSIILSGYLPLSIIFLLQPMLLLIFEMFYRYKIKLLLAVILTATLNALLVFTHLQYGSYAVMFFYILVISRYFLNIHRGNFVDLNRELYRKYLYFSLLLSLLFTAWFIIPFIIEKKFLLISSSNTLEMLIGDLSHKRLESILKLFHYTRYKTDWLFYYLGTIPLIVLTTGIYLNRKSKNLTIQSYAFMLILGIFLIILSPRFINILFVYISVLLGFALNPLMHYIKKTTKIRYNVFFRSW